VYFLSVLAVLPVSISQDPEIFSMLMHSHLAIFSQAALHSATDFPFSILPI
jgi:hypothetical protein